MRSSILLLLDLLLGLLLHDDRGLRLLHAGFKVDCRPLPRGKRHLHSFVADLGGKPLGFPPVDVALDLLVDQSAFVRCQTDTSFA